MRAGFSFLKFLITTVFFAVVVVLAWGAYANFGKERTIVDQDGRTRVEKNGVTFHLLDQQWWQHSKDKAQPHIEQNKERLKHYLRESKKWAVQFKEDWQDGGLVDQAEDMVADRAKERIVTELDQSLRAPGSAPAEQQQKSAKQTQPATNEPSTRTRRLEEKINTAEEIFSEGLAYYREADPNVSEWTNERVALIVQARDRFKRCNELVLPTIEDYESMPDHSPQLLAYAKRLVSKSQHLLANTNKMIAVK